MPFEAVRDDFDAPGMSDRHFEAHVGEPDVASDPCAGLAAHTRDSMLERRARVASTPDVAQAVRWSPSASSYPRQLHLRGANGRGSRRRSSRRTRKRALGTETSSHVGVTLKTRAAKGPAWESSRVRDAGAKSEKCISYTRLSQEWAASRCQLPLKGQRSRGAPVGSGRGALPVGHSGASKPESQRRWGARTAAVAHGKAP